MPERRPTDDNTVPKVGGIDTDILEQIGQHLKRSNRFAETVFQQEYAPSSVVAEYDMGYFPTAIERTYLQVRWYETDDFNIHHSEQYDTGNHWECRWDHHPNYHKIRSHFHPPLDATTPGDDVEYEED
ncbi:hypothetical protein [Natronorubrum aibiense]|uniref:hypothetical protein n=1 Tax=Natronorubrum aibiense TaxID=348826 RepID=UPI0029CA3820|nr:hypothetical protein [Natronorubrum aibiense]